MEGDGRGIGYFKVISGNFPEGTEETREKKSE
jgi:hypothetical protein